MWPIKDRCASGAFIGMLLAFLALSISVQGAETVWISQLDISKDKVRQGWGEPHADKSVDGHPLVIGGKKFEHGLGTHAVSTLYIDLKDGAERFTAYVGIDDEVKKDPRSSVVFRVVGDGRELWKSGLMKSDQPPKKIDVSLKGVKYLLLNVDKADESIAFDHADWADAKIEYTGERPETVFSPPEEAVILTPPPSPAPRINGARVFGVRPGVPFLFTIPATGRRPMTFSADNLPDGLRLDAQTGQISGAIEKRGEYLVILGATNALAQDQRELQIVCGDTIALTPPMGWSSWSCYGEKVDDAKVRAAADAMVQSGLINHGWTYVNIDQGWHFQPNSDNPLVQGNPRDENGVIQANKKFPDMKALCDYIHEKGLKAGIYGPRGLYSSNLAEAYQRQEKDIQRFAHWGFDYYRFNWGSYSRVNRERGLPGLIEVYQTIYGALNNARRDMVFSTCAPSMFRDKGDEIGGNCWMATADITDRWTSIVDIGFDKAGSEQSARPGHWNNADALVVGTVGWGEPRQTRLTPNEQYTQVSLWCLLSSPLMIGSDLTQIDDFTLNLLTNDEVLEVNQDPLGKQARRLNQNDNLEVWAKEMEDGSVAVGLFNRSEMEQDVVVNFNDLNLSGKQIVRDLWRQKDLGEFENQFSATVPRHGVVLVRLRPSGK